MKKHLAVFFAVLLAFAVVGVFGNLKSPKVEGIQEFLGAGLPDTGQVFSTAASASKEHTIKAASSRLFACKVINQGNAGQRAFFQLFNKADEPNYNSTPVFSFAIPASTSTTGWLDVDNTFFSPAVRFGTGLTFGISSDDDTYTSESINEVWFDVNCIYE